MKMNSSAWRKPDARHISFFGSGLPRKPFQKSLDWDFRSIFLPWKRI